MERTELNVEGMSCASCVRHINQALHALVGVGEVDVRLQDRKVIVRHDASLADVERLVATLRTAGYESSAR